MGLKEWLRNGQLADGSDYDRSFLQQIGTSTNWISFATGRAHTAALKDDGTIWAWGKNNSGQLGNSSTTDQHQPIKIGNDTNWSQIAAGDSHTVALKTDGTLWAWGYNVYGQVGDGTTVNRTTPTQIGTDTDWTDIKSMGNHSLALKKDGTLWAWGWNKKGQLGGGSTTNRTTPTMIEDDASWKSISAGESHTVAIKSDGSLWEWGTAWMPPDYYHPFRSFELPKKIDPNTKVTLNPLSIDFGLVAIQSTGVRTLQVLNNSDKRLPKPKLSISSPVFDAVAECNSISAKDYCTIRITFSPIDLEPANAFLDIDGRRVELAGHGVHGSTENPPNGVTDQGW